MCCEQHLIHCSCVIFVLRAWSTIFDSLIGDTVEKPRELQNNYSLEVHEKVHSSICFFLRSNFVFASLHQFRQAASEAILGFFAFSRLLGGIALLSFVRVLPIEAAEEGIEF